MSTTSPLQRAMREEQRRHVIVEVRFVQAREQGIPADQAPILCSCTAVVPSIEWDRHRGARRHGASFTWEP